MAGTSEDKRRGSENRRENSGKKSPAEIQRCLHGIHYPVQKRDLINHAKNNGADEDVMDILNRFEEKEYGSPAEVSKEIGRVE